MTAVGDKPRKLKDPGETGFFLPMAARGALELALALYELREPGWCLRVPGIRALRLTRVVLGENWCSTTLNSIAPERFCLWSWLLFPILMPAAVLLPLDTWLGETRLRREFDRSHEAIALAAAEVQPCGLLRALRGHRKVQLLGEQSAVHFLAHVRWQSAQAWACGQRVRHPQQLPSPSVRR